MKDNFSLAVASGKGGTGKTTVTAALAEVWSDPLIVADMDAEAPNLHLYLPPETETRDDIFVEVPKWESEKCTLCGKCSDFCRFGGIHLIGEKVMICSEMCHACGGCLYVCPTGAIAPAKEKVGEIIEGPRGANHMMTGQIKVGTPMSPPVIRKMWKKLENRTTPVLIDSPPGANCPAIAATEKADFILLVTEPTPFGLHDLEKAVAAFRTFDTPMALVINRAEETPFPDLDTFCKAEDIPILARLPYQRNAATAYGKGYSLAGVDAFWKKKFETLAKDILSWMKS